jgi:hypothetical protein
MYEFSAWILVAQFRPQPVNAAEPVWVLTFVVTDVMECNDAVTNEG